MEVVLLFALEDLRARYVSAGAGEGDPRHDTAPFRAFRAALLDALSSAARAPATLGMWWEGGYNGYALAVSIDPGDAVPDAEAAASRACPVDGVRDGAARREPYPLAAVAPGRAEVARDRDGAAMEAPFGAPTGHFGAPGMRRMA
jgi:hypothetical protein